jgi:tellurite resistance protein
LDYQAKERILEAALDVASADGFVLEEEDTLLATIAAAMGITEGQYKRTMNRLLEHRGKDLS